MMQRTERKCLICNQKYYSPEQDERHTHPNAKITEAGGGTIAESHPPTNIETKSPPSNIQLDSEKKAQALSTSQDAGGIDEASGKKIKKFDVPSFIVNKPVPQSVEPHPPRISLEAEAKKEAVLAKKREVRRKYVRKATA